MTITLAEFAFLAIFTRTFAWYWVHADVFAGPHDAIERAIRRKAFPEEQGPPLERVAQAVQDIADNFLRLTEGEEPRKSSRPLSERLWGFVLKGWNCSLCSGQWIAFVAFGLWTSTLPTGWGWKGLMTAVAVNGVGVMWTQVGQLSICFTDSSVLKVASRTKIEGDEE